MSSSECYWRGRRTWILYKNVCTGHTITLVVCNPMSIPNVALLSIVLTEAHMWYKFLGPNSIMALYVSLPGPSGLCPLEVSTTLALKSFPSGPNGLYNWGHVALWAPLKGSGVRRGLRFGGAGDRTGLELI